MILDPDRIDWTKAAEDDVLIDDYYDGLVPIEKLRKYYKKRKDKDNDFWRV